MGAPRMRDARWVKPELVCQVRFTEWTRDGSLRHPSFEGLREDKKAEKVVREVEKAVEPLEEKAAHAKKLGREVKVGKLVITHPERVVDTESGITKGDLARYAGVMATVVPAVREEAAAHAGAMHRRLGSRERRRPAGEAAEATVVLRAEALGPRAGREHRTRRGRRRGGALRHEGGEVVSLVQLNTVELHGWGSRMPRYDKPDWIVLRPRSRTSACRSRTWWRPRSICATSSRRWAS